MLAVHSDDKFEEGIPHIPTSQPQAEPLPDARPNMDKSVKLPLIWCVFDIVNAANDREGFNNKINIMEWLKHSGVRRDNISLDFRGRGSKGFLFAKQIEELADVCVQKQFEGMKTLKDREKELNMFNIEAHQYIVITYLKEYCGGEVNYDHISAYSSRNGGKGKKKKSKKKKGGGSKKRKSKPKKKSKRKTKMRK